MKRKRMELSRLKDLAYVKFNDVHESKKRGRDPFALDDQTYVELCMLEQ